MKFRSAIRNAGRFFGVLMLAAVTTRGDAGSEFAAANQLYEQGRFPEAAHAYEQLIEHGTDTAGIHYNLANSRYKAGHLGAALGHWRLAQSASPRQPEIESNLRFAQANAPALRPSALQPWESWVRHLTLNEWTALALGSLWLWTAIRMLSTLRPTFATGLRGYTLVVAIAAVLSLVGLGISVWCPLSGHSPW